jgi:hypothetical protein
MLKKILISLLIFLVLALIWYFGYYINTPSYLIDKLKKKCKNMDITDDALKRMTTSELKSILSKNNC